MRLADLSGRRVALWGFGREGRASLLALRALRPAPTQVVIVTDSAPADRSDAAGHQWVVSGGGLPALLAADVVIRSPGISRYREDAQRVAAETSVTTGTNLWFAEHADEPIIAVTGSKGKSTTTSLIDHLVRAAGRRVVLAGNIGVPLLSHLKPPKPPDVWVLELSSQQTADMVHSPRVGVLLNLYREHIDWHGSLDRYIDDKLNLFRHRADGVVVLNRQDPLTGAHALGLPGIAWFGDHDGYHPDGDRILYGDTDIFDAGSLRLRGRHNLLNLCAGLTACDRLDIDVRGRLQTLEDFHPLRHRLEPLDEVDGVLYINDSIATIPEAVVAALDTVGDRPTVLLAGGFDRGQDFTPLVQRLPGSSVSAVIAMPPSGRRLAVAIESVPGAPRVVLAEDLADAVARARAWTRPGSAVLLSPAAPSYGLFRDFEDRGDAFRRLVAELKPLRGRAEPRSTG